MINPRLPRGHELVDTTIVSFVPMAAVDETLGRIVAPPDRTFAEVKKGYTSFQDKDVLFAKITPCMQNGKAAIARHLRRGIGFGSTEFHVLRAGESVLPEWIFYFVRQSSFRDEAKLNFTGTAGQLRVPTSFMETVRIPLPPLEEQRRLVELLARAEGIMRLRREARALAAQVTSSLFLDMFGDPASNPKGWPEVMLGEVILAGPQNGIYKHKSLYGEGTPILRIDGFYDGDVRDLSLLLRVRIDPEEIERYGLMPEDIVVNRVNSPEYLGKSALIPFLREPTVFESNIMRIRIDGDRCMPRFMIEVLQTESVRRQILARAKHAINQSSVNQGDVKALRFGLPPIRLQEQFVAKAEAVRAIIVQQDHALEKAFATFDALLQHAFSR